MANYAQGRYQAQKQNAQHKEFLSLAFLCLIERDFCQVSGFDASNEGAVFVKKFDPQVRYEVMVARFRIGWQCEAGKECIRSIPRRAD